MPETTITPDRPRSSTSDKPAAGRRFTREPPHSVDAERALLGSMLLDEAAISEAVTTLRDAGPTVFFGDRHRRLYEFILSIWDESKPLDGVLIKDELVRRGEFESLG